MRQLFYTLSFLSLFYLYFKNVNCGELSCEFHNQTNSDVTFSLTDDNYTTFYRNSISPGEKIPLITQYPKCIHLLQKRTNYMCHSLMPRLNQHNKTIIFTFSLNKKNYIILSYKIGENALSNECFLLPLASDHKIRIDKAKNIVNDQVNLKAESDPETIEQKIRREYGEYDNRYNYIVNNSQFELYCDVKLVESEFYVVIPPGERRKFLFYSDNQIIKISGKYIDPKTKKTKEVIYNFAEKNKGLKIFKFITDIEGNPTVSFL